MIEIDEDISVSAPPDQVWKVLSDPAEVVSCIDGAELGEEHEDGSFDGTLYVRFSAIRVRFGARVTLELDESERRGRLSARGRDTQGATRYHAHADFAVVDGLTAELTRIQVTGEVHLTGRLASLIEAGAGAVVSRMTRDFTDELARRCRGEVPEPTADPASAAGATSLPAGPTTGPAGTAPVSRRRALWSLLRSWWQQTVRTRQNKQSGVGHGTSQ